MSDISLTASFGDAPPEKLGFRWVLNIFLRTWPFIRPSLKHLVYFVVLSGLLSLYSLFLLFIVFGLTTTGVVAGDPVGSVPVAIWGLDPDVYVNVESLSDDARRALIWPTLISAGVLVGTIFPGGYALQYYSIWIFLDPCRHVTERKRDDCRRPPALCGRRGHLFTGNAPMRLWRKRIWWSTSAAIQEGR